MSLSNEFLALGIDATDFNPHAESIQRLRLIGKRQRDGWCIVHQNNPLLVTLGNWKTSEKVTVVDGATTRQFARPPYGRRVRPADSEAADTSKQLWRDAGPADVNHPYLIAKGVGTDGIRQEGSALLIPMRNEFGHLFSLQRIFPDGRKRFLKGGRVSGLHCMLGEVYRVLLLAEGYATAAILHEVTGHPVAACFSCGNLEKVGYAVRRRYPNAELIYCADNDARTEGNPGLTFAKKAMLATGDRMKYPKFQTQDVGSDWNDFAILFGREAVAREFANV